MLRKSFFLNDLTSCKYEFIVIMNNRVGIKAAHNMDHGLVEGEKAESGTERGRVHLGGGALRSAAG
jgi:hypothetical protein